VTPFAHWRGQAQPVTVTIDPPINMASPPLDQVNNMCAEDFSPAAWARCNIIRRAQLTGHSADR
jgi:hypothetical protein